MKKYRNIKNAFSLMEMMVVLLIVSIIAAATAPMVTKKMMRSAGSGDSPWVFTGLGGSIAYNMSGNKNDPVIIGAMRYNANNSGVDAPRLVVAGGDGLAFADNNGKFTSRIMISDTSVAINDAGVGENSVAIGMGQNIDKTLNKIVAIGANNTVKRPAGNDSSWSNNSAVVIGSDNGVETRGGIVIGTGNASVLTSHPDATASGYSRRGIMIGNQNWASDGIAIGDDCSSNSNSVAMGASAKSTGKASISIGHESKAKGNKSIAIGSSDYWYSTESSASSAEATGEDSIAIGTAAKALGRDSVAIGDFSESHGSSVAIRGKAEGLDSVAIKGRTENGGSMAIGSNSVSSHAGSSAIGRGARTTANYQIVLGQRGDTVYIPGHLVVEGNCVLSNRDGVVMMRENIDKSHKMWVFGNTKGRKSFAEGMFFDSGNITLGGVNYLSDHRLKNVGEKYTAGLDELKKLDLYHYTFKKDEAKTPMVGVMAQDLQKVFPDAVTKGDDGYLRIRLEDMFYAVINAVKELDAKISQIVADVTGISSKVDEQQKVIEAQQQKIDELEKVNADFEKRLAKLEKNNEKKNK